MLLSGVAYKPKEQRQQMKSHVYKITRARIDTSFLFPKRTNTLSVGSDKTFSSLVVKGIKTEIRSTL
jgi:hypothetical protein